MAAGRQNFTNQSKDARDKRERDREASGSRGSASGNRTNSSGDRPNATGSGTGQ